MPLAPDVSPHLSPPHPARVVLAAAVESGIAIVALLAAGALLGVPDRFAQISPHPFWLVVILVAVQYGSAGGIAAAALASAAFLIGNIPEQTFDQTLAQWLLHLTAQPVIWFLTAIVLGEIRAGQARAHDELVSDFTRLRTQAESIATAYAELSGLHAGLERRIAANRRTLGAAYDASRAIERNDIGSVVEGVPALVAALLDVRKFSLFLLRDGALQAAARVNWRDCEGLETCFAPGSDLHEAIVVRRRSLHVFDPADETMLAGQGLFAVPLVDRDDARVSGMLKIEDMDFGAVTPEAIDNLHIAGSWIGSALGRAARIEEAAQAGTRKMARRPMTTLIMPTRARTKQWTAGPLDRLVIAARKRKIVELAYEEPADGSAVNAAHLARADHGGA